MSLLAIDPSLRSLGASLFEGPELVACTRIIAAMGTDVEVGVRCLGLASQVNTWITGLRARIDSLVFEWPQIYSEKQHKSKGDPNQLVPLAGIGMAVASMLAVRGTLADLRTPTPHDWVGQCPKVCPKCHGKAAKKCKVCEGSAWKTPRGRRIRACATPAELARVPDQHDAIDSFGIGLWGVGRFKLVQIFPGAV